MKGDLGSTDFDIVEGHVVESDMIESYGINSDAYCMLEIES